MLFGGRRGVSSHDFGVVKGFSQGFGMEEVFSLMILGWERRSPTPMQWDDDGWGVLEGGENPCPPSIFWNTPVPRSRGGDVLPDPVH